MAAVDRTKSPSYTDPNITSKACNYDYLPCLLYYYPRTTLLTHISPYMEVPYTPSSPSSEWTIDEVNTIEDGNAGAIKLMLNILARSINSMSTTFLYELTTRI